MRLTLSAFGWTFLDVGLLEREAQDEDEGSDELPDEGANMAGPSTSTEVALPFGFLRSSDPVFREVEHY